MANSFTFLIGLFCIFDIARFFSVEAYFQTVRLQGINCGPNPGASNPFLFQVNGRPAIVYADSRGVGYIRADNNLGTTWSPLITSRNIRVSSLNPILNVKQLSAAILNKRPAILSANASAVFYIRATNVDGTGWKCLKKVVTTAPVLPISDLVPTLGFPTFALSGPAFWYIRAEDVNGDDWPKKPGTNGNMDFNPWRTIFDGVLRQGTGGYIPSLAIVNGIPSLAFSPTNPSTDVISYITSTAPQGADGRWMDWGGITRIGALYPVVDQIILKNVGGKPAIVYSARQVDQRYNGYKIFYQLANDCNGTSWSLARVLYMSTNPYLGIAFAIIAGKPTVAFADKTYGNIHLAVARDSQGLNWDVNVVVPNALLSAPFRVSLAQINGRTAFAYLEADGNVVFAYESGCVPAQTSITVDWCQANCPNGQYGGACTSAYCTCPIISSGGSGSPAPAPPSSESVSSSESAAGSLSSESIQSSSSEVFSLCRACVKSADPLDLSCLGTATDEWCALNCAEGGTQYNEVCNEALCQCPPPPVPAAQSSSSLNSGSESSSSEEAPAPQPCVPCTKETNPECYGVTDAFWCSVNCAENGTRYGGSCQSAFCYCPADQP